MTEIRAEIRACTQCGRRFLIAGNAAHAPAWRCDNCIQFSSTTEVLP